MRPIRSIIVFNSATAGDFLTALCWSQLKMPGELLQQESSGRMNLKNSYFKSLTTKIFYGQSSPEEFDVGKISPVENSHYWLDWYQTIADRCVFIDYPERIQQGIMEIYLEKVFANDRQKMLDLNLSHQSPALAKHINIHNIDHVLNIHWQKNIKAWRHNTAMSNIDLADFIDREKMSRMVKSLIDQDLTDLQTFNEIYDNWLDKNRKLSNLF